MDENDSASLERGASNDITRLRWRLKICENVIARLMVDRSQPIKPDTTPDTHATRSEGNVQDRCTEHWLQHAHGRILAGDSEPDVLADYGWAQITAVERWAIVYARSSLVALDPLDSYAADTLSHLLERLT